MQPERNPFAEAERFFDRMSRQFEDATREWDSFGGISLGQESMAVDLIERDDELLATVDLPGFEREDVAVRVTDHTLRISAEQEETTDEADEHYIRRERQHRSLSRSLRLPEVIDTESIEATMKNGVLTVTLPKETTADDEQVEITIE